MFDLVTLTGEELVAYLNNTKGEVIYLGREDSQHWNLVFRKSVMGRPKREEPRDRGEVRIEQLPMPDDMTKEPPPIPMGFPRSKDA